MWVGSVWVGPDKIIKGLKKQLATYGAHTLDCMSELTAGACDCGWDKAEANLALLITDRADAEAFAGE